MLVNRLALTLAIAASFVVASDAPAGGIADETCPNVRGENTNTCPPGTVGTPYSIRFSEREGSGCGPGRQTFRHDSGVLPAGLTLAPDGTLSGTPQATGIFQFYVEMREPVDDPANCAGKKTEKQFTLTVRRQPWIVSTPVATPRSEAGVPFKVRLRARGGSGVFAWELAAGRPPAGVRIGADGSIAGIPRAPGTYRFAVKARDTEARSVRWETELSVAPRLRIRDRPVPAARVGRPYRAELVAAGGVGPLVWSIRHGRLPRGVRLASAFGRLTGTPKAPGGHVVTLEARDRLGVTAMRTFRILVRAVTLARGAS